MEERFREYYEKITDPRVFIQDKWYKKPTSGELLEFLIWYNETHWDCLESTDSHFRVVAYPASMIRSIKESISDKVASYGDFYTKAYDPDILAERLKKDSVTEKRVIPGTDRPMSLIAQNIMKKEAEEKEKDYQKHKEYLDFQKRKRDFMNQAIYDDDDL